MAPIIKSSQVKGLILRFVHCNLSSKSEELLADAFASNSYLSGFTCIQNPHNFDPITQDYKPTASVQKLEEAALRNKSPYLMIFQNIWHHNHIVVRSPVYAALNQLGFSEYRLFQYSRALMNYGCGTVKLIALMNDRHLNNAGIIHELHYKLLLTFIERLQSSVIDPDVLECPNTIEGTLLASGLPVEDLLEYVWKLEVYGCTTTDMLFHMKTEWFRAAGFTNDLHLEAILNYLNQDELPKNHLLLKGSYDATKCISPSFSNDKLPADTLFRSREEYLIVGLVIVILVVNSLSLILRNNRRERFFVTLSGVILLLMN